MNYQYIIYGIFGAILFPLLYDLSLKKNTKLCALIPALPLLGITGLKAKEILPYTLVLLLTGIVIFISGLLIF